MLVFDDYKDGVVHVGSSVSDIILHIDESSQELEDTLRNLEVNKSDTTVYFINNYGYDGYAFNAEPDALFKYLADRDCINYMRCS